MNIIIILLPKIICGDSFLVKYKHVLCHQRFNDFHSISILYMFPNYYDLSTISVVLAERNIAAMPVIDDAGKVIGTYVRTYICNKEQNIRKQKNSKTEGYKVEQETEYKYSKIIDGNKSCQNYSQNESAAVI